MTFGQHAKSQRARRGQASLFDGLTFLTLSTISVAFIFMALGNYGALQQSVINKAHITNYVFNAFKTLYYVDASTLANFTEAGGVECSELSSWVGMSTAELIKRDLRDFSGGNTGLDDTYGISAAPGKLAARCAFKEIFRPFTSAGYSYFVDFSFTAGPSISTQVSGIGAVDSVYQKDKKITNDQNIKNCSMDFYPEKMVVNSPFQVFKCINDNGEQKCGTDEFIMTACLWPTQR